MQTKHIFLIALLTITGALFAQSPVLILNQKNTQQPVQYANVCWQLLDNLAQKGNAVSDDKGKVKLGAKIGERIILSVTCIGCKPVYDTILVKQSQVINVEEDILNLEQVTVTGTRTTHTLKEAPVLTQMVTRREIERIDATTIIDILETEVPGIEMGRHGYGQTMSVQGLEPQYTLILIDGERMAGETGGNVDYSRINASNIERIEIVRGASSALYGSNAMGGVINIITKKPRKKFDISANIRYAQPNQSNYNSEQTYPSVWERDFFKNQDKKNINTNLSLGFRNKKFYTNTFFNYKSFDGYHIEDKEKLKYHYVNADTIVQGNLGTMTISGFTDYTINQKVGYENDKWAFELRGNYYEHEEFPVKEYNYLFDFHPDSIKTYGHTKTHEFYKNYTLGGKVAYKLSSSNSIQINHNSDVYNKYDVFEEAGNTKLNYKNTFHNTKVNCSYAVNSKHNLFMGIENLHEILETDMFISDASRLIPKSSNDAVIVLQDEFKISSRLNTVIGLRGGYHSTFDFHASPSLTVRYNLKPVNLRFNYAKGYRSPTLKELYMDWSHMGMFQIVGSTDLKPETNDYFAFSADYINKNKNLNATVISSFNQINNKIDGVWSSDSLVNYLNLDKVKVFNIETILKWRVHTNFNLKGGYVYTNQIKDNEVVSLSEVSPHALTSQFEFLYTKNKFRLTANLAGKFYSKKTIEGKEDDEDSPLFEETYEIRYPSYSLWNLIANMNYGKHIGLSMGLKNLFNYTSPTVTMNTTPNIGRRYFISCTYKF